MILTPGMRLVGRILISVLLGAAFYVGLVIIVLRPYVPYATKKIFLWNIVLINSIGRPDPLYYFPDGSPIYDGSFGLMGYSWVSVLSGFAIYPVIILILITWITWLLKKKGSQDILATEPPAPPKFR